VKPAPGAGLIRVDEVGVRGRAVRELDEVAVEARRVVALLVAHQHRSAIELVELADDLGIALVEQAGVHAELHQRVAWRGPRRAEEARGGQHLVPRLALHERAVDEEAFDTVRSGHRARTCHAGARAYSRPTWGILPAPLDRAHHPWAVAIGLSLCTACGSRSSLLVAAGGGAGTGAVGGNGGSSAGGTGATGGLGGTVTSCSSLVKIEPTLEVGAASGADDDDLRLTAIGDGQGEVTASFERLVGKGPGVVHHVTLSPWTSWPASGVLGDVHSTFIEVDSRHQPVRTSGGLYGFAARLASGEAAFVTGADPHADGALGNEFALDGIDAMFAAARGSAPVAGDATHLVGTFTTPGAVLSQRVSESAPVGPTMTLACASGQAPRAGAVAFQDGWLVAVSTGTPFGGCFDPSLPGSPHRVELLAVGATPSEAPAVVTGIDVGETVIDVQAAPHPDGIWVGWKTVNGATGNGDLFVMRVDVKNGTVVGPVAVSAGENTSGFALAALGPWLAVVREPDPGTIALSVHDASLATLATASYAPGPLLGLGAALGSPNGGSVLVGWSAQDAGFRVRLARFDCVP
jgi:hypothetical protein